MSPPHPIRAVSFDLDGTLYATGAHRLRLLPHLLPQLPLIRAWGSAVNAARGAQAPDIAGDVHRGIAQRLGISEEEARARLWFFLERTWIAALRPAHLRPGLQEALTLLDARGLPRSVASDHPPVHKLAALGVAAGWCAALDGEALGGMKPLPDVLFAAAEAMDCSPEALLHIGDRDDMDGAAARAAKAHYLCVFDEKGRTASLPARLAALLDARPEEHLP
jgi:beta-phosphoglucomutase-like phosphatase (HAD superfamily)